ncbi:MAG: hypothetical protein DME76_06105 [Verrucomicrobia bacterium]|nr:MAG: hypothetical protein DME76_06105 [Verrucomicrobiota bacterium]
MSSIVNGWAARAKVISLAVGVLGLAGCIVGWILAPGDFFVAYLFGHFFFLGLSLGALALLMTHHLTSGYWGYSVRRFLESAVGNLPLLAVLFVPVFFGLPELYPWKNPSIVAADKILRSRLYYLNTPGYIIRSAVVFAIWILMARLLLKWSAEQDATVSVEPTRKMRTLSGPGLVIYPITMTFAAMDWLMSLEKDWYSTMFAVMICIGQMLGALAFVILLLSVAADSRQLGPIISKEETFHKIGNLLLAFTMLWAYLEFGQLLITWSGNLPHEISWYLNRVTDGWRWVCVFLFFFNFFIPFFLLLMRPVKRRYQVLASVAGCIFIAHIVDVWWTITPSLHPEHIYVTWWAIIAFLGIGGIWSAAFLKNLERRPALPLNDPRFAVAVPA